eukprot:783323-Prorocentrum_minimum.AAC.1
MSSSTVGSLSGSLTASSSPRARSSPVSLLSTSKRWCERVLKYKSTLSDLGSAHPPRSRMIRFSNSPAHRTSASDFVLGDPPPYFARSPASSGKTRKKARLTI